MAKTNIRRKSKLIALLMITALSACAAPPREQRPASLGQGSSPSGAVYTTPLRSTGFLSPTPAPKFDRELTLAVRFVSYVDPEGRPTASRSLAHEFIERANQIYATCDVRFELEQYLAVRPHGIPFHLASMDDLDPTRARFEDLTRLVIIDTGNWNHNGMGMANAWTALPGTSPSGSVLEAAANDHAELIAHELGHYLNLDHVNDSRNLMNPVIYHSSTRLDAGQCQMVRQTALDARVASLR